jgi:hypothetical protein
LVLCELLDRSIIKIAWRNPGAANPVGEMTSRVRKTAYRKSSVAQNHEVVRKLFDHGCQSPRIQMRPA